MKCNNCVNKKTCVKNDDFLMDLDNDCKEAESEERDHTEFISECGETR